MHRAIDSARRSLLKTLALGAALIPVLDITSGNAFAADPLLRVDDPAAKARNYVEDAGRSSTAPPGRHCGNCALYEGAAGSTQGPCQVFPGRQVKAAGWCSAWMPQM